MTVFDGKRKFPTEIKINGPMDYYIAARAGRDVGKASIDLVYDEE